jgi:hypothetical protein
MKDSSAAETPRSVFVTPEFRAKKRASRLLSGPYSCEGKNLQRGTVVAAALGGKPLSSTTDRDMVPKWAVNKDQSCMSGMRGVHGFRNSYPNYL